MNVARLLLLLLMLAVAWPAAEAREFRRIAPIARPEALPSGAERLAEARPVDRTLVEQAVHAVARAWNTGEMDPLLADDYASKSRLLDTLAEVVPRDARLSVLGIEAVSTLEQYRLAGKLVSTVSAVVRSQIEFNDPVVGFVRLPGRSEWYFRVEGGEGRESPLSKRERVRLEAEAEHRTMVAGLNARLPPPPAAMALAPGLSAIRPANADALTTTALPLERLPADWPSIDVVFPTIATWDNEIIIGGRNFHRVSGRPVDVYVVTRESRQRVDFFMNTWKESQIAAVVEPAARTELRYLPGITAPMTVMLWVDFNTIDDATGRPRRVGREIVLHPPRSLLTPEITAVQSGGPA